MINKCFSISMCTVALLSFSSVSWKTTSSSLWRIFCIYLRIIRKGLFLKKEEACVKIIFAFCVQLRQKVTVTLLSRTCSWITILFLLSTNHILLLGLGLGLGGKKGDKNKVFDQNLPPILGAYAKDLNKLIAPPINWMVLDLHKKIYTVNFHVHIQFSKR